MVGGLLFEGMTGTPWQCYDEGSIAGAWEVKSFPKVDLLTRLHLISGRRLPALA